MATFTTNPDHAANFVWFDIADLDGDYLYNASATTWRVGPFMVDAGSSLEFQGVGFTYSGGALTGGTINTITSRSNGAVDFQITGMSMSAAAFNAYQDADNTQGFLAAVFNGNDTITGSNLADILMGFAGADHLNGLDGNDVLDGGAGADTLTGGKGDDTYVIDSALDVIMESGGSLHDRVQASISVDLTKAAFNGIEDAWLTGNANLTATGDSGANNLIGNDGANKLTGGSGDDTLSGAAGADTLDGGLGDDDMYGGGGNDTYYVDSPGDSVHEDILVFGDTGGNDTVFSTQSFSLPDYVEKLTLTGTAVSGYGNNLDNTITGNASDNFLDGKTGADTMTGGAGNDVYVFHDNKDKAVELANGGTDDEIYSYVSCTMSNYIEELLLLGNSAFDGTGNGSDNTIYGNENINKISGGAGNDVLYGKDGSDTLTGGSGNDDLYGGKGNDTLDGGAGNDTIFITSTADGYDVIQGFDGAPAGGQDILDLNYFFDYLGVDVPDRATRVGVEDTGGVVNIWIDTDDDNALDLKIAEIHTIDVIKVNEDIRVAPVE